MQRPCRRSPQLRSTSTREGRLPSRCRTGRRFSLGEVIEGIGELYGPLADEKSLSFQVNKPAITATIRGNRNLISQAVANLVDNAIKYTPEGGSVVVGLEQVPDGPQLVVSDSGPGIPAEERLRVTERFVRLESSRNSPGTGLGLSLVAAVARLHEAEFVLEDNRPGLRAVLRFKGVEPATRATKAASRAEPRVERVH